MTQLLLVDDDEIFCESAARMLQLLGHSVSVVHSLEAGMSAVSENHYEHIFLDFMLPDGSGLHLLDQIKKGIDAPFVTIITGHPAVKNILHGLCGPRVNYLVKPLTREKVEAAIAGKKVGSTFAQYDDDGAEGKIQRHFGCLVGESDCMSKVYKMIERVAKTTANVMLIGESGVGKEVVAQAIHNASETGKDLVAANCGALSRELIGSELFGHEKGAFTGAVSRKIGYFEQAEGGTLFLDEITEMPIDMQPTLLRVLETGRLIRVGGTKELPVDCRVISATNRSSDEMAADQVLREDLYFRLAVFPIKIPALRDRGEDDISLLADCFVEEMNAENGTQYALTDKQKRTLADYDWPGNVRELRHTMHRALIMSDPSESAIELPDELHSPFGKQKKSPLQVSPGQKIDDMERELIQVTLSKLKGDKVKAADMLGISLKTLYNRLNKYQEQDQLDVRN